MTYTREEADLIIVDGFSELTHKQKHLFVRSTDEGEPSSAKYAAELIKTLGDGVYNKLKQKFCDQTERDRLLSRLDKKGIACVTLKSALYPKALAQIPVPPNVLYCKGDVGLLSSRCFAVVGSRRTLAAGLSACRRISEELCSYFTVVTGIADGADSAAAEGAAGCGKVICVLPYGHDYMNRAGNSLFLKSVSERGLVISELPPETAPQRYLYTVRNRIIAGMSEGVLVTSAAAHSGALNTAGYAADYGREVFAFPYSIGVASGVGCNGLIKNGAYLCENVLDIFSCFGLEYNAKKEQQLSCDEQAVLDYLKENGEAHAQAVANAVGKKPFQVITVCSSLEIKGLVVKTGGNKYAATV